MQKYEIRRSKRKTLSLLIDKDSKVIVKASRKIPLSEIDRFVCAHNEWIEEHIAIVKRRFITKELTIEEEKKIFEFANYIIPKKVESFSDITGLIPTGVKITKAKTRFGSCSAKNSLCFSLRLAMYPDEVIDYVVVHELCHIRFRNHGKEFYRSVEAYIPNYKECQKILKQL